MADARAVDNPDKSVGSEYTESYLRDEDLALFDHHFYWRYDDLFLRIRKEDAAVRSCVKKVDQEQLALQDAVLDILQQRINRLQQIQKILNDRQLDDFKEVIYPAAKFVPALALFGIGGLSIALGPVFAFLFAGGFLVSNLYLKGKHSMLNVHFGIATSIQATAVILGICTLAGVASVNPGIIMGLVAAGGTWLFCAAVFRGGMRHTEARDIKLAGIESNLQSFHKQLGKIKDKIRTWSINPTIREKNYASMDVLIHSQLWKKSIDIEAISLITKYNISEEDASAIMNDMKVLKIFYDDYQYNLRDFENLLRTVKNPFEKSRRIHDLAVLEEHAMKLQAEIPEFPELTHELRQNAQDTREDVNFVMKKDMPWFLTNIPLLAVAGLSAPMVGILILGSPLMLSPPVLISIGAVAVAVGLIYVGFRVREKYVQRQRERRDEEKRKLHESLEIPQQKKSASSSATLKKKSKKTPMLLIPKKKLPKKTMPKIETVKQRPQDHDTKKTKNKDQA